MNRLLLLSLVACATGSSQLPPPGVLTVQSTPLVPGAAGVVWVDGALPGRTVHLAASLAGIGPGACPPALNGACLELAGSSTYLGSATADADGVARWQVQVPPLPSATVALQAATLGPSPTLSAPVSVTTRDYGQPGPHTVQTNSHILSLGGLFGTRIPLTIYTPDTGPAPTIVLHHGFQLSAADYVSYGEHLASWGFAVVMPAMPGGLLNPRTHTELAGDLTAVLDFVESDGLAPNGPFAGVADTDRLGLAGHSMGGKISMLVAADDPRVDAVFGIDPVDAGPPFAFDPADYPSVAPERMADITVPLGIIGETIDASGGLFGQSCAPAGDNFVEYTDAAVSPVVELDLLGADHMDFLDNPGCLACLACGPGTAPTEQTRTITRRTMTAFFEFTLRDDDPARAAIDGAARADAESGVLTIRSANGW